VANLDVDADADADGDDTGEPADNDLDGDGDDTGEPAGNDLDGDGFDGGVDGDDCDDDDASVYPGAEEVAYDDIDQDCDGADLTDVDGDGFDGGESGDDCSDDDATVYPGADEVPYDAIDQDCDGADLTDVDGDGFDGGESGDDCNDDDATVYPGADEVPYDTIDQDCDGADLTDVDGDGWTVDEGDCDDDDRDVNPGADEVCNGIDDDCDDRIDEGFEVTTWYEDYDGDGYGDPDVDESSCDRPDGHVTDDTDCNDIDDTVYPGADEHTGDGTDSNCDGYDTDFEQCSEDAVSAAIDYWTDGWTRGRSDHACSSWLYDCEISEQYITVDLDYASVSATEADPLVMGVTIYASLDFVGRVQMVDNDCLMEANNIDVVYTGTLELDIESDGDVDPNPSIYGTMLDTPSTFLELSTYSSTASCDPSMAEFFAAITGFDLEAFVDDAAGEAVDALASDIEAEIEWQYDYSGHCPGE